ncbi:GntR family transcriptional regulator [Aeromicrobium wangtongii]|uniref:GntR family transcriptional regulator n=1 Tax=Aeromicrobium wangtongii TaxID=2969247 RepID=UPI0020177C38|nr:GntR family transcriptional regulator [Aeromicrobium wangtongii]MCL3818283.1 GntR family transcriptional regulator [Aeromicrobium wangtongii]
MTRPGSVRSVEVVSAVEQVTREIRRSILSGDLRPGEEFSLRSIAEQLGVSLIPVREALRQLEMQGLVVTRRARSALVAPLDPQEFKAIYRHRLGIEPELAGRACTLLTAADFDRLDRLHEAHAVAVDRDVRHQAHHTLHVEMLRPAATAWDVRILDLLWHASERYVQHAFSEQEDEPALTNERGQEHIDLLAAMRTRDPHRASEALQRHLLHTKTIVLSAIERTTSDEDMRTGPCDQA